MTPGLQSIRLGAAIFLFVAWGMSTSPAFGQQPGQNEDAVGAEAASEQLAISPARESLRSSTAVTTITTEELETRRPLFSDDLASVIAQPISNLRGQTEEKANLTFNFGYTLVAQFGDGSDLVGGGASNIVSGSYDFSGAWTLCPANSQVGGGAIGWLVEGGHNIGQERTEDLAANLGVDLGVNADADPSNAIVLSELWWQQGYGPVVIDAAEDGEEPAIRLVTLTAGKIDQTAFFDANRVANDEHALFLSPPLVNSVAIAFPEPGLGLNLWVQLNDMVYVTGGFGDANAVNSHGPVDFDASQLFWAGEIGVTPQIEGLGPGSYRFMGWHTRIDNGGGVDDGGGFSLSFDQQVAPGIVPFFRYSVGDDEVVTYEQMVQGGVAFEGICGGGFDDTLGVGFTHAKPANANLREESAIELYYRMKITETIEVSPSVQVVFNPAGNPTEDEVVLASLRTRFNF